MSGKRLNIFFILCDELRADALGFMGNSVVKTPNLDSLAREGVVFTKSYCNTPMCVPSRVSIATGRHAMSHGAMDNVLSPLDSEVSLFSMLKNIGYRTFSHGKWHCNIDPLKFGMDVNNTAVNETSIPEKYVACFGISDRETRKRTYYKRNQGEIPLIIYGKRPSNAKDTLDSVVTKNYIRELEEMEKDKPYFARLSIMDPHTPYFPAQPYASMYNPDELEMPKSLGVDMDTKPVLQRFFHKIRGFDLLTEDDFRKSKAAYYGLVTHVDYRVGQAINKIKSLNLYDDSLIIFTADHGSMLGEQNFIEKWGYMYEPVMHTPLIMKFPKGEYSGKELTSFVESIDILPTILDVLGEEIPKNVHGKSLMPYIKGEVDKHKEEVYAQYYCGGIQNEPAYMVRDEKYKLTLYKEGNDLEKRIFPDHPLAMTEFFDKDPVLGELYDLLEDPDEANNLFNTSEYVEIREKYESKINKWIESIKPIVKTKTYSGDNKASYHMIIQGQKIAKLNEDISYDKLEIAKNEEESNG